MKLAIPVFLVFIAAIGLTGLSATKATTTTTELQRWTIWDGVYSASQAAGGQELIGQCRGCHGANMDGGQAPPLRGEKFMDYWREDTLDSMYTLIKTSMPPRADNQLSQSQTLSLMALILQANGFPAGNDDLEVGSLGNIHIEGRNGPQPLPNYAVVQTVGCTAKGEGENWLLVRSTEPIRARNPGRASDNELKIAAAKNLGTNQFQLQNLAMSGISSSALKENQKMLAKGPLIRQDDGDRISITSLQPVTGSCEP